LSTPTIRRPLRWLAPVPGLFCLLLYGLTMPPSLTWAHQGADGGDLIAAAMTWGVPHPSGYPTYCLLARLFAILPLEPIARRFNWFSAVAMAAAASVLYLAILRAWQRLGQRVDTVYGVMAMLAAMAWGSGYVVWSQAIIAEVYALTALFAALWLYLALEARTPLHWIALGAALGAGLGSHLALLWLLPAVAALVWRQANLRSLSLGLAGFAVGISVYLYLPLAARRNPPVSWGAAESWGGFWWLVSGALYRGYLFGLPLAELPARLQGWLSVWVREVHPLGLALLFLGARSWLHRRAYALSIALAWSILAVSAFAIGYATADSYIYLVLAFLPATFWIAQGAAYLAQILNARYARWLVVGLLAIVPLWSMARNLPALNLRHDHTPELWFERIADDLPPNAVAITGDDRHTFALRYFVYAEARRPDLVLVDGELLVHDWYRQQLYERHPELAPATSPSLLGFAQANVETHALYLVDPRPGLERYLRLEPTGDIWRLAPPASP